MGVNPQVPRFIKPSDNQPLRQLRQSHYPTIEESSPSIRTTCTSSQRLSTITMGLDKKASSRDDGIVLVLPTGRRLTTTARLPSIVDATSPVRHCGYMLSAHDQPRHDLLEPTAAVSQRSSFWSGVACLVSKGASMPSWIWHPKTGVPGC